MVENDKYQALLWCQSLSWSSFHPTSKMVTCREAQNTDGSTLACTHTSVFERSGAITWEIILKSTGICDRSLN